MKQTIIALDGKKYKRTIQHIGQGFDSHVTINGIQYDVTNIVHWTLRILSMTSRLVMELGNVSSRRS